MLYNNPIFENPNKFDEPLCFYTDFNGQDEYRDLKQKYKKQLVKLEKQIFDHHFENIFKHFKIFWVTLNPKFDLSISFQKKCFKIIHSQLSKNCLAASIYNFEINVSGESNDKLLKHRLHSHSLIFIDRVNLKKNTGFTALINSFFQKKIMGSVNSVHIVPVSTHETLIQKTRYVLGIKTDPVKRRNAEKDRIWRKTIGLKDYYKLLPNMKRNAERLNERHEHLETMVKYHMECLIEKLLNAESIELTFS